MKKFQFNLKTLLNVRKEAENAAHKEFLEANIHLQKTFQELEIIEKEYFALSESVMNKQKQPFYAEQMTDMHEYLLMLEKKVNAQVEEVVKAQNKLEDKRQAIIKATQQKKIIEKLQEKQYASWLEEFNKTEMAFFDEVSTIVYMRERNELS